MFAWVCDVSDSTVEKYLEYLQVERNASPRTVLAYRRALCDFKRFMDPNVRWRTSQPDNFRAFLRDCMQREWKRSYVRLTFAALRSFYQFLIEREGYSINPIEHLQLPNEILSKVVLSGTGSASWYHLDNAVRRVFGADDERFAKLA